VSVSTAFSLAHCLSWVDLESLADAVFGAALPHVSADWFPYFHHLHAEHLMRHGRREEAISALALVTPGDVNYPHAQAYLHVVLQELGRSREAAEARDRAFAEATEDQLPQVSTILDGSMLSGIRADLEAFRRRLNG
jgi:hypothetical protein